VCTYVTETWPTWLLNDSSYQKIYNINTN
jgi:hypothetical protein